jgi:hypothetical protein
MESKASLKRRLTEDGRWSQFVEYREELKRNGMPTPEAWITAAAEFPEQGIGDGGRNEQPGRKDAGQQTELPAIPLPPLLSDESSNASVAKTVLGNGWNKPDPVLREQFSGKKPRNMRERIEWVWGSLGIVDIQPEDAPDSQSWFLLSWARTPAGKTEFFRSFVARLLPSKNSAEEEEKFFDDGRRVLEIIERVERESRISVLPPCPQGTESQS